MTTLTSEQVQQIEEALLSCFEGFCQNQYFSQPKVSKALDIISAAKAQGQAGQEWPHGATVKLRFAAYGPYKPGSGWAKRGAQGELLSAYSLLPLDESQWEVVEERAAPVESVSQNTDSWCIEPKPVNGLLSVEQTDHATDVDSTTREPVSIQRFGLNPDNGLMYESERGPWCLYKDVTSVNLVKQEPVKNELLDVINRVCRCIEKQVNSAIAKVTGG